MIGILGLAPDATVVDVGGGAPSLAGALVLAPAPAEIGGHRLHGERHLAVVGLPKLAAAAAGPDDHVKGERSERRPV